MIITAAICSEKYTESNGVLPHFHLLNPARSKCESKVNTRWMPASRISANEIQSVKLIPWSANFSNQFKASNSVSESGRKISNEPDE